ncbi:response regulator transcription factor [Neobacillus kokaensis]|uniref:Response regulator n=1 Tax=Neobacillus kokaensis TaxID=2759023 RepID=A0ABQ3N067_9BACI|nr:response regulator [Neobacillus kokaensis]GHH98057.1 hypothetical protein AM1BK_16000 [Neobacillus kokaensis]
MNKYIQALVKNVRTKLESWFNGQGTIEHQEIYRFLHSIAGTAATIGFEQAGEAARALMGQLNEDDQKEWEKDELQQFLFPLISIFYYEELTTIDEIIERKQDFKDKKLILLIDDDPAVIMLLKEVLQENGWVVLTAANPEKAIHSYNDLNPDCIIINYMVQGKSGLQVLRRIRKELNQPFTPAIIISKDTSKDTRVSSYQHGADDYIVIPFEADEFIVRVRRQLERKQAIDELVFHVERNEERELETVSSEGEIKVSDNHIHVGIVDDDPIIRTMLTDLISKSKMVEGFTLEIKAFKDGMEFYESNWYSQHNRPYLIILDGMMPRMDGMEVLKKLRGLDDQDKFTIIMLTSRKNEHDISSAIQLGADDYLTKPFKLLELETRLGYLIKRMKL